MCERQICGTRNDLSKPSSCSPKQTSNGIRKDVIYGMNAISHVPEPYLDPVLLIDGRRVARTQFTSWSYKIVVDEPRNTLPKVEPCGMYVYARISIMILHARAVFMFARPGSDLQL